MSRLVTPLLLLALGAPPAPAQQVSDARLERRTAADPATALAGLGAGQAWLSWTVPGIPAVAGVCCFRGGDWNVRGCRLDARDHGWGTRDDWPGAKLPAELVVLAEVERGRPRRLRAVGGACPIEGGGRALVALDGVVPESSLDLLERWARDAATEDEVREAALAAIGYHADPAAASRLERLALDRDLEPELRKNALFWTGQTRGVAVVPVVDRFLAGAEPSLREHAYFVLAQTHAPEAWARLRQASREDPATEGRGQALFWLAESDAPEAAAWILASLRAERSPEVREQAVFALAQLDDGAVHLARLLHETRDPGLRRQALFWLAQSEDPRALAEVERILER